MKLDFYFREEQCPMHYYEAMQIFAHLYGMPEFHGSSFFEDENVDSVLLVDEKIINIRIIDARKSAEIDPLYGSGRLPINDRNLLKRYLYRILTDIYDYNSPWGAMTGVRPTKIYHKLLNEGFTEDEILEHFEKFYLMSKKKASIVVDTYNNQESFLHLHDNEVGFYVGIPFCPTICSYCTFGSSPYKRYEKRVPEYIDALCDEIRKKSEIINKTYKVTMIYMGGGTPTSLTAEDISTVLSTIVSSFDMSVVKEFCVEAGRPDTITREKLLAIKSFGVTRISINPQTMNEKTLRIIGRKHTPEDTVSAFNLARQLGFENINMDIIAGLPDENAQDFSYTLESLRNLNPDGLTVHTLALKRASQLSHDEDQKELVHARETEIMVDNAKEFAKSLGLRPFYMYRQKNCVGNNENVSYAKPSKESPYNIHIMDEDMTIFGAGVGAVTKIVTKESIEREFNPKSVEEYLSKKHEAKSKKQ